MSFSKKDAIDATRAILQGARSAEQPRLDNIKAWLTPGMTPTVEIPADAPPVMRRLAAKAEANYLPLVSKTFSQVMKLDGLYSPSSPERSRGWEHWQRNGMDARQTGTVRSALNYGAAYELVLPGTTGPVSQGLSPRRLTAVYQDPARDEYPMMALDVDGSMMRLIDDGVIHYIGAENKPRGTFESESLNMAGAGLTYIESRQHGVGVPPVVRFRDRMLFDGEEQFGIIEPLLALQARMHETNFGLLVTQFVAAFKQRYVIGWAPDSELEAMRATASDTWFFKDTDVEVGQFAESDLGQYIEAKADAKRDLAAIAQISVQNLGTDGVSNVSAEALASLQDSRDKEADEITTSLGESWEQWFRLCAHITGDTAGASDFAAEVRWKDATARSFAQTVDGLGKLAQMLEYPKELLWEKIPGASQTEIDRAKVLRKREQAQARLAVLSSAAAQARTDPAVAQVTAQRAGAE